MRLLEAGEGSFKENAAEKWDSDPNIKSIESLKMNPKVHYDFY